MGTSCWAHQEHYGDEDSLSLNSTGEPERGEAYPQTVCHLANSHANSGVHPTAYKGAFLSGPQFARVTRATLDRHTMFLKSSAGPQFARVTLLPWIDTPCF